MIAMQSGRKWGFGSFKKPSRDFAMGVDLMSSTVRQYLVGKIVRLDKDGSARALESLESFTSIE